MSSLLSHYIDNLTGGIQKSKHKTSKCCLQYLTNENDLLIFKYLHCGKKLKKN